MTRVVLICLGALFCARSVAAGTVDASKYDAFWLWSGVKPQPVLKQARSVYVLQGQIEAKHGDESQVRFIAQGVAVPRKAAGRGLAGLSRAYVALDAARIRHPAGAATPLATGGK